MRCSPPAPYSASANFDSLPLDEKLTSVITAIDIASKRVYVTRWGRIDAFEIENGSRVFSIGD